MHRTNVSERSDITVVVTLEIGFGPLAEAVRFELTDGRPSPVFKTGALNRSATLPVIRRMSA